MIQIKAIDGWREYIHDGEQYLKTALGGSSKRSGVFTPEIIYNIIGMSIEKYIMGYLLYHRSLPNNHTLRDLVEAVDAVQPMEKDLFERVVHMERFQEICSIDDYRREAPDQDAVQEFLAAGQQVRDLVTRRLASSL